MRISNKFIFTGFAVILGFVLVYQLIKSSAPIQIQEENLSSFTVYGKEYKGDWNSDEIQLMYESGDSIAKLCDGISTAIYYNDPDETDGYMETFIGVSNCENDPTYFSDSKEFSSGDYLKGIISNNYFQIPQRVYVEMKNYAADKDIKIGDFSIEQYFSDTLMIVYIPILEK